MGEYFFTGSDSCHHTNQDKEEIENPENDSTDNADVAPFVRILTFLKSKIVIAGSKSIRNRSCVYNRGDTERPAAQNSNDNRFCKMCLRTYSSTLSHIQVYTLDGLRVGFAIGRPQWGQFTAASEIWAPQSGHTISAIELKDLG